MDKLKEFIDYCSTKYYLEEPIISDHTYDLLQRDLEKQNVAKIYD